MVSDLFGTSHPGNTSRIQSVIGDERATDPRRLVARGVALEEGSDMATSQSDGDLEQVLARWQSAGIITSDQAGQILAHEREWGVVTDQDPGGTTRDERRSLQLGSIISYIGGFLILFALTIFIGSGWDSMSRGRSLPGHWLPSGGCWPRDSRSGAFHRRGSVATC